MTGTAALVAGYRGIVCDLDGVVYRGADAVPYAVEALTRARAERPIVYATNNASRTAATVAAQLVGLGLSVHPHEVVTSAQAGACRLAADLGAGALVLVVGGAGVSEAVSGAGLTPRTAAEPGIRAVLQGYGPQVSAADLAEAAFAVAGGATWVATNTDRTLPTERGIAPGNGTLVAAVATATGATPIVVGKPYPPLYHLAADVLGTRPAETLAIGDRLDTDIAGATRTGMDSAWVLTGVDGLVELAASAATPTYALLDLSELHHGYRVDRVDGGWVCDGVRVCRAPGGVRVDPPTSDRQTRAYIRAVLRAGARLVCQMRDAGPGPGAAGEVAVTLTEQIATMRDVAGGSSVVGIDNEEG